MNPSLLPVARPLLALRRPPRAADASPRAADASPLAGRRGRGGRGGRGLGVSRRGSILIFVVALLVLLAVIGTAYISTTRTDRYATQQNGYNTEVDLLVDGVQNAVEAQLLAGLFRDGKFRPAGDANYRDATGFDLSPLTDATLNPPVNVPAGEALLASRIPTLYDPNDITGSSYPMWNAISAPVLDNAFESPVPPTATPNEPRYDMRLRMQPGSVMVDGKLMPALAAPRAPAVGSIAGDPTFVAADTDGDGEADAGLVRIPVGRIAGLTYYCAVRVIDNGSAVNVNTAGSRSMDFAGNGSGVALSPLFKAQVGLLEMLQTFQSGQVETAVAMAGAGTPNFSTINHDALSTEYLKLDQWRTGVPSARAAGILLSPLGTQPIRDTGVADPNFNFLTMGDAFRAQLARRTDNPGLNTATLPYRAYSLSDTTSLIYPFGLTGGGTTGTSQLEQDLDLSLKRQAAGSMAGPDRAAFAANETDLWFDASFNFNAELHGMNVTPGTFRPIRTLLTGNNGVSNLTPARYDGAGARAVPTQITTAFANSGVADLTTYFSSGASAARVSANTADVRKLWWAYWQVMSDFNTLDNQFDSPFWRQERLFTNGGGNLFDPYLGGRFDDPGPGVYTGFAPSAPRTGTQSPKPVTPQTAEYHPDRMFRSPLRAVNPSPGTEIKTPVVPRILPKGMALVRSAIAAANAVDWRDVNYDVTPLDTNAATYRPLTINLTVADREIDGIAGSLNVTVYGQEPQPFITEVFVQTDISDSSPRAKIDGANDGGYIAIELHNPYPFAIDLLNCKLGLIDRGATGGYPNLTLVDSSTAAAPINLAAATSNLDTGAAYTPPTVIPAGGYLVLENYDATGTAVGTDAKHRPGSLNLPPAWTADPTVTAPKPILSAVAGPKVNFAFVSNLATAMNHELVLLRPLSYERLLPVANNKRLALPQATIGGVPMSDFLRYAQPANQALAVNFYDFAPLDSYDFTGISTAVTSAWHYVRANGTANPWQFVYPGRYDGDQATGRPRQQGTQQATPWNPLGGPTSAPETDPWDAQTPPTGGAVAGVQPTPAVQVGQVDPQASFPISFTIQLADPGRYPLGTANVLDTQTPFYPFGGFARDGDLLQVPFIGAYTVRVPGAGANLQQAQIVEMNPVTMDAVFAEDTDTNDDPATSTPPTLSPPAPDDLYKEQLGRFSPLARFGTGVTIPDEGTNMVLYDDLYVPPAGYPDEPTLGYPADALGLSRLRYAWARSLFDFLQVSAPQEDFLPDITTNKAIDLKIATPEAVANAVGSPNGATERTYPEQGRVNINTAPLKVMDMIPFVPTGTDASIFTYDTGTGKLTVTAGQDQVPDNLQIARAVVNFRDGNPQFGIAPAGPFGSLFDLFRLDAVRLAQENAFRIRGNGTTSDPGLAAGDFTPVPGTGTTEVSPDGIRYDFEERNLLLTRISNLVTTRSDTFTVYLLVQGWSNAGTANAKVEVERRRAFTFDRSRVGPAGQGAIAYPAPIR